MSFCIRIAAFPGLVTLIMLLLTGCNFFPPVRAECEIAPPKDSHVDQQITQKVGLDLSAFVKVPIKGTFENDLKNKADLAFQELSEKNTACHMLLATVTCLNKQPNGQNLASQLTNYLMSSKQCEEATPEGQRKQFEKAFPEEWVGISNQSDNEQLPSERPVDLAKVPHKMMQDIVHLTLKDGVVSGTSKGQGLVWENSGYLRDGVLVLAYRTAGSHGRGFGLHLLVDQDGYNEVYVGYLEGRDCMIGAIIKYPYLLVNGQPGSREVDRAKEKHANLLKQHGAVVNPLVCK